MASHDGIDLSNPDIESIDNGISVHEQKVHRFDERALGVRVEHIFANTPEQIGHMESFHGKLKREYIWTREFRNYQEAEIAIAEAVVDYNQKRPHSSLEYRTPYEFLEEWRMTH